MKKINQANLLKFFAMLVASPRLLGWALISVGYVPTGEVLSYLHSFEGVAGFALAALEGWAIAFIFAKWGSVKRNTLDFWSLTFVLLLLVATFIFVSTPYLYFMQVAPVSVVAMFEPLGQPLATVVQVLWCAASISASILVVVGVGIADVDELAREKEYFAYQRDKRRLEAKDRREVVEDETTTQRIAYEAELLRERMKAKHQIELKRIKSETATEVNELVEKLYECPYCSQRFEKQNGLNGHLSHCKARANGNGKATKAEQQEVVG